jgi:hypothetical protein
MMTNRLASAIPEADTTFETARREFRRAWEEPEYTRFKFPPVNVNDVLRARYRVTPKIQLTRAMLWDLQRKKAQDPVTYMPYSATEVRIWARHVQKDGSERFFRSSLQQGLITQRQGLILDEISICHLEQRIIFLSRQSLRDDYGTELTANAFQPLFHINRSVGGTEDEPFNLSSIVLLSSDKSGRYFEPFAERVCTGCLPRFIEIYIQRDLRADLTRL